MSDTPVTISGFSMGRFVMFMTTFFRQDFMELMPIAASVPSSVAPMAALTAMMSVFVSACSSMRSWNSISYQRREKPDQTVRLFVSVSLKEKTTSNRIGA